MYDERINAAAWIVLAAILTVVFLLSVGINTYRCHGIGQVMGAPAKYAPMRGCFVQDGGRWVPVPME